MPKIRKLSCVEKTRYLNNIREIGHIRSKTIESPNEITTKKREYITVFFVVYFVKKKYTFVTEYVKL